ncbi:DUF2946 domain-containing protein [Massilia endophytica]|uniref:DUF2946 domain-containing protein n=1 Tax=Massilia endophytica TaxID=2899220 RepID=UPI001E59AFDD|nr:DUF2946 domain-containing protein [Massilia endophytica]UGQ47899.1 DUF2946 domain-containing protein [Massilia endophytica]
MRKSTTRLFSAWIACFAILLNALAPSVSHAMAFAQGQQKTWEICLNDGTRLSGVGELDEARFRALTDRSKPAAPAMQMNMADCGYCLTHAGSTGLPPVDATLLLPEGAGRIHPPLFYQAPGPLEIWVAAHPRGPPANA